MDTNDTLKTAVRPTLTGVTPRQWLRFFMFALLPGIILFVAAGTLRWTFGWIYVVFGLLSTVLSRLIVLRTNPDLLAERAGSLEAENAKPWDKVIVPVLALAAPIIGLIVAGLDHRFGWSPALPLWAHIAAFGFVIAGWGLGMWAMAVNRYFSGVVRIQHDRGHTVCDHGPYRLVRHPAYSGSLVFYAAMPVMLNTLWALIPGLLTMLLLVVRTALEDRTLIAELPGYAEYATHTRHRLIPGIW